MYVVWTILDQVRPSACDFENVNIWRKFGLEVFEHVLLKWALLVDLASKIQRLLGKIIGYQSMESVTITELHLKLQPENCLRLLVEARIFFSWAFYSGSLEAESKTHDKGKVQFIVHQAKYMLLRSLIAQKSS